MLNRSYFLCLLALLALGSFSLQAKRKKICNPSTCATDPSCQCYCARKCGYRDKEAGDKPIYVRPEDDPYGFGCYCKKWDFDNAGRCVNEQK